MAGVVFRPAGQKENWCIMRNLVGALALFVTGGLVLAAERTVIVPADAKPFTVEKADIVRLTGKGIAGSKIEIKVDGPAKVQNENSVIEKKGGATLIGNSIREFEIQPTDTGKVTVTITVTPPNAQPTVTKYQFEVK
jgi:hypothetical protein